MNEYDLHSKLLELEASAELVQFDINFPIDKSDRASHEKQLQSIKNEILNLRERLVLIKDKTFSKNAKASMVSQLNVYRKELESKIELKMISKKQGLSIDNELIGRIVSDIEFVLTKNPSIIQNHNDLQYTSIKEDGIDIIMLIDFLNMEVDILNNINHVNYLILREYKEGLIKRIENQFM